MAAGLGFKTFTTGEVLTAADTNGYLMQGILVFASATARDAAITSPQEGQFAYLKDTNVTTYYTGSAWANVDTTGMTNPMTTTGDTIYSSSGSTPARLGIGSTGNVLTVAGGVPTWAAPAGGGGMTLISTTTLSGASTTISSIPATYVHLQLVIRDWLPSDDDSYMQIRYNNDSSNNYRNLTSNSLDNNALSFNESWLPCNTDNDNSVAEGISIFNIYDYANTTTWKLASMNAISVNATTTSQFNARFRPILAYNQTSAISRLDFFTGGTFTSGTVLLYGVK
jgi:hypothetical protein